MNKNLQLFEKCLKNREMVLDPYYCHDESMIISEAFDKKETTVMKLARNVRSRLTAIRIALEDSNQADITVHLREIARNLDQANANYIEFTSFFPVIDFTFSIYRKLSENEKIEFLDAAVRRFIQQRHAAYEFHGYSATTIQVRKDFERHKSRGSHGSTKVSDILQGFGYNPKSKLSEGTRLEKGSYILPSSGVAYNDMRMSLQESDDLRFAWSDGRQGKLPDLILRSHTGRLCIAEFKHIKEGGGGQDKQLAELINLISHKEGNISYIAFMDGIYFNRFADLVESNKSRSTKLNRQLNEIRDLLERNSTNFFVNTFGFTTLLNPKESWLK